MEWVLPDRVVPYMLGFLRGGQVYGGHDVGQLPLPAGPSYIAGPFDYFEGPGLPDGNQPTSHVYRSKGGVFTPRVWEEVAVSNYSYEGPSNHAEGGRFSLTRPNYSSSLGGLVDSPGGSVVAAYGDCVNPLWGEKGRVDFDCFGADPRKVAFATGVRLVGTVNRVENSPNGDPLLKFYSVAAGADVGTDGEVVIRIMSGDGYIEYLVDDSWKDHFSSTRIRYTMFEPDSLTSVLEVWPNGLYPTRYSFEFTPRGKLRSRYRVDRNHKDDYAVIETDFGVSGGMSGFMSWVESPSRDSMIPWRGNGDFTDTSADFMREAHAQISESCFEPWFKTEVVFNRMVWRNGYVICKWGDSEGTSPKMKHWMESTGDGEFEIRNEWGPFLRFEFN